MRKMMMKDVFRAARLITKAGIKEELKKIVTKDDYKDKLEGGMDLVSVVISGMSNEKLEKELYEFAADILECKPEDIETSDPIELVERFRNDEGHESWADFFTRVMKLMAK